MTLKRTVVPEELDHLQPDDPSAIRSRNDLTRVHRAMGTCGVLTQALSVAVPHRSMGHLPLRVLELGAGDGTLMLRVARALKPRWPQVQLTLLDQVDLLAPKTHAAYAATGWSANPMTIDALEWARQQNAQSTPGQDKMPLWDVVVANLFLHHFEREDLQTLLAAISRCSRVFVACEPRRSGLALAASHWIGALGAGSVTRADAVTSVRAGFSGAELSALWPPLSDGWVLAERPAGLFSHCFKAKRIEPVARD